MLCRFLVGNLGLFRPTDVRYLRDAMRKQVGTSYANAMATDPVAELFYCNCVGVWNKIKKDGDRSFYFTAIVRTA